MHKETSIEKCRCTSYTSVACASSSEKGRGALDIARATAPGAPPHPASCETRARSPDSSADAVNALPYETGRYIPKSGTCVSLSAGQHRQLPYPHPFLCSHKMHEDICVWSRGAVEIQGGRGWKREGRSGRLFLLESPACLEALAPALRTRHLPVSLYLITGVVHCPLFLFWCLRLLFVGHPLGIGV